jgi:fucose permease
MTSPVPRAPLFVAACAGIFVFGTILALLGTLFGLAGMRARLGVDLSGQGDLFLLQFLGIFVSTALAGPLIDRYGKKVILTASSALVGLSLALFAQAHGFRSAAVSALVLGLGAGGLSTANNVLVSDLYDTDRAARFNLLGVWFGVGALVVPLATAGLSTRLGIATLLVIASLLAFTCAVLYLSLTFPAAHEAENFTLRRAAGVARYPGVLLFGALFFCQSGNEASIGGWTSTYVGERGWDPEVGTWVLAGYWAALLIGRVASAGLLAGADKSRVVLVSGVGSVIGAAVLLVASRLWEMVAGVALLGLSFANVYPVGLAMVGDRYRSFTGTVFGGLFSVGLVGSMLFPWAIGHIGERYGVRPGMTLPLAGAVLICGLVLAIERRHPSPPATR